MTKETRNNFLQKSVLLYSRKHLAKEQSRERAFKLRSLQVAIELGYDTFVDDVQLHVASNVSPALLVEGVQLWAAIVTWLTRDACLDHTGQSHELVHAFDASVALSNGHYGIGFGDGQYFGQLCDEGRMVVHSVQSGSAESARKLSEI
ncbi:hypothetical protein MRX96_059809 [Rhipicephalus microplus]